MKILFIERQKMPQNHEQDNNQLIMGLTIEADNSMLHIEDSIELEMAKLKTLLIQKAEAVHTANASSAYENKHETLITE